MLDWKVVVPSYNRVEGFVKMTLATLQYHKVPPSKIYLFVADEEQKKLYEAGVPKGAVGHIVVGIKGLVNVRNFIFNYFPKCTPLVSFDDDVRGFVRLDPHGKNGLRPLRPAEFAQCVELAFRECDKVGARFWGDYPVPNAFFMKPTISHDFKFVIGSFWGCYNPGSDVQITIGNGSKEDYMRGIQFWQQDGAIVRLNWLAHKTATYGTPGGLQSNGVLARQAREHEVVDAMMEKYPEYIRLNPRRKGIMPEILLKRSAPRPSNPTRKCLRGRNVRGTRRSSRGKK